MRDALGRLQRVVVVGGTSAIARAAMARWARERRGLEVTLLARPGARRDEAAAELTALAAKVECVDLDAEADLEAQRARIEAAFDGGGDVDLVLVALGALGDQERAWQDPAAALRLVDVNARAPIFVGVIAAERLRRQGHGALVLLSSVAGERVRRSNFAYGATKAAADDFYRGLAQALAPDGVHVMVVRPGFVRTPMTEGLDEAPLAQDPTDVAQDIDAGLAAGASVIWSPATMRVVMAGLKSLPAPIFRRLPI